MPVGLVTTKPAPSSAASSPLLSWLRGQQGTPRVKIRRRELTFVLRNLATLIDNGLALPKALSTLARERALRKYAPILESIRRKVESGDSFSAALGCFPESFGELMVHQVRVGERSGDLGGSLGRIAEQLEKSDQVRSQVLRKLAYPLVLLCAGTVAVIFMLIFVIPVFEETYAEAKVPLPWITDFLISVGRVVSTYGWIVPLAVVAAVVIIRRARKRPAAALRMDAAILRLPLLGPWLRDLAVLEFMDVLGNLLESGFNVVDALGASAGSIGNRAVRHSVEQLQSAVTRGERFSRELDRQGELFPPVVSQLVIVGERTGSLAKATGHIRGHLRREIERTTNIMVGTIEPVLTISLAAIIAVILLAIYLPMFDMIGTMNGGAR